MHSPYTPLLYFTLLSLDSDQEVSADGNADSLLFLVHDYDCKYERTMVTFLRETNIISEKQAAEFDESVNQFRNVEHRARLQATPKERRDSHDIQHPGKEFLSNLPWQARRDEAVSTLDYLVAQKFGVGSNFTSLSTPFKTRFLSTLGIDVVGDSVLPRQETFYLASSLPCLAAKPERNFYRQPANGASPNDPQYPSQFHLRPGRRGISALSAWELYNGELYKCANHYCWAAKIEF